MHLSPCKLLCALSIGMTLSLTGCSDDDDDKSAALEPIPATAQANGLTTLTAAVEAADLAATLSDESNLFTVFAPTNQAFADLGSTLTTLLEPANQA